MLNDLHLKFLSKVVVHRFMWTKMSLHNPQQNIPFSHCREGLVRDSRGGCAPKKAWMAARQLEKLAHLQGVSMLNKEIQGQT